MGRPKRRAYTQEQPRPQLANAAPWESAPKPVQVDHFGLFRWPGPMLCEVEIGGLVPPHCFATKVVSFAEAHFAEAAAAGFEWVTWAKP